MEITNLDHLGLVAGIIDEIGIESIINRRLGQHSSEKISPGKVVKAMSLNALGLVSSPLYLFAKFFEGKPREHLIGKGVKAEQLNDDKLGRVMDGLYGEGNGDIFVEVVLVKNLSDRDGNIPSRCKFISCSWRVRRCLLGALLAQKRRHLGIIIRGG